MARTTRGKRLRRAGGKLTAPAEAVMQAFRLAKSSAPPFMSSCGIFPEVSELASDRLHSIVNDVATRRLGKRRHARALQRNIQRLLASAKGADRPKQILDRIGGDLTALLAAEATAAYLFGLSVGLTVRTLPERLDR
jgi:hypothetical protein